MVNSCHLQHYHGCWARRRGGCNHNRVPATVQLGSQPRHSPFVGTVGQLTPQAAERGSCRLPARAAPACPTVWALGPLAKSLEGTLPRWKDTCQGRAHSESETVDFGERHHKKGAAGRYASCFNLSLSEELLQRVTGLTQVTHTEV